MPTAVADLHEGETVLDLGSGAGADVLISARRVGPTGTAIGLDMTDEMLELARKNAAEAGVENVEFVKGYIEQMPVEDASVDVIISNCVINLAADKNKVIAEAARVLRPGGRFAVSDVLADEDMDEETRADMAAWTGCIGGALTDTEFRGALQAAGFESIEIEETHRVHEHAGSAIIRARKPGGEHCCDPQELSSCCEPTVRSECCGRARVSRRPRAAAARDRDPPQRAQVPLPATGSRPAGARRDGVQTFSSGTPSRRGTPADAAQRGFVSRTAAGRNLRSPPALHRDEFRARLQHQPAFFELPRGGPPGSSRLVSKAAEVDAG